MKMQEQKEDQHDKQLEREVIILSIQATYQVYLGNSQSYSKKDRTLTIITRCIKDANTSSV